GFLGGSGYVFEAVDVLSENGASCNSPNDCLSNNCVDDVCCDVACGGSNADDCQACSVAAGSSTNGVCELRAGGTVCRGAADLCDAVEQCDGVASGCPADGVRAAGDECRPAADLCD